MGRVGLRLSLATGVNIVFSGLLFVFGFELSKGNFTLVVMMELVSFRHHDHNVKTWKHFLH